MEQWKEVENFEGLYEVSTLGKVRSLTRNSKVETKKGVKYIRKLKGRALRLNRLSAGYLAIELYKNGSMIKQCVHRLVASAFVENKENKPCVNHKNGVKDDNSLGNLEWVTYSENEIHSHRVLGKKVWLKGERAVSNEKLARIISKRKKTRLKDFLPKCKEAFELQLSGEKLKNIAIVQSISRRQVSERIKRYKEFKVVS